MKFIPTLIIVLLISSHSQAEEKSENKTIGCWESNVMEYGNSTTVCVNHDSAAISFLFDNKDENTGVSEPTICSQIADVEYKNEGILIIRGFPGKCRNGREQAPITLKCTRTKSEKMPCELYLAHKDLSFTKIENRK
jgi:hypothetical protein